MYETSRNTSDNWDTMMEIINDYGFTAEDMLRLLTDWHGMYLLDQSFMENLINCEL